MKRLMAWVCPRMLVCGSRVSGSLAAMFRTFFWASAGAGYDEGDDGEHGQAQEREP